MNIIEDIRKVGMFEVAHNMIKAAGDSSRSRLEDFMPMPGTDFDLRIKAAVDYLLSFGKSKIFLLSPEIAILDELAKRNISGLRIFVAIPSDMPTEMRERLYHNVPKDLTIQFVENLYCPGGFIPENGIIVSFGYSANGYLIVRPDCYHMNKVYSSFPGARVFVPYVELDEYLQCEGWVRIQPDTFTEVWRSVL